MIVKLVIVNFFICNKCFSTLYSSKKIHMPPLSVALYIEEEAPELQLIECAL